MYKPYNSNSFPHWHWTPPFRTIFFSFHKLGWLDRFGRLTELFIHGHIELDLGFTHPNDAGTHHISSLERKHGPGWLVIYDCQAQMEKNFSWNGWSMINPISPGKTKNMNIFEKTHILNMRMVGSRSLSLSLSPNKILCKHSGKMVWLKDLTKKKPSESCGSTWIGPTPSGVPVRIKSPASKVKILVISTISCGTWKIMSWTNSRAKPRKETRCVCATYIRSIRNREHTCKNM